MLAEHTGGMSTTTVRAELSSIGSTIGDLRGRLGVLATPAPGISEELLVALIEAERSLGVALRLVERAQRSVH